MTVPQPEQSDDATAAWQDKIVHGDCRTALERFPPRCADLVLTDPPYLVRYTDRSGRTVRNDNPAANVLDAFVEVERLMKPNTFCVSFYGWNRVDVFFRAWRRAGLAPVGHLVFVKTYASSARFLRYTHEQAYLLAKGQPRPPRELIADVLPWHYTGNLSHPTEKSVDTLRPIIAAFTKGGDVILDPFAGSGSTLVAAALLRRRYIGVEIDGEYCELARRRLAGVRRHLLEGPKHPT
jgi:site-specific DNA-methyltransferase (adenine-specific)